MTQATLKAKQEMDTKMTDSTSSKSKGTKRSSQPPKTESKKRKTKAEPSPPPTPAPTPVDDKEYGCYNAMQIVYNTTYITIQKFKSKFRLYGRQLIALQSDLLKMTAAIQDQEHLELTLPGEVKVALKKFEETGLYVELSKKLKDGMDWTMNLKTSEFVYLIESLPELLEKINQDERRPAIEMSASAVQDEAVRVFADLVGAEITQLKSKHCNGCVIGHPSQRQHTCMEDDVATIEGFYLDAAVEAISEEKFTRVFKQKTEDKRVLVSPKLMWHLCRKGTMLQQVKNVAMTPFLLKQEIASLTEDDVAAAIVDLQANVKA